MAFRTAALIAVGSVAGASAAACPDSTDPMISVVTDISPECFEQCPQMCKPIGEVVSEYLATSDTDAVKGKVCANPAPFSCAFEADHAAACGKVLAAGSAMGVELPATAAQLQEQCGLSKGNLRGGGEQHRDIEGQDAGDAGSNSSNSTNATEVDNETAPQPDDSSNNGGSDDNSSSAADISAAGGRGFVGGASASLVGLLAYLGAAAL